jgi:Fic family protein
MEEKVLEDLMESGPKVRILRLFLVNPGETFSLSEIVTKANVPRATAQRYLNKFTKLGVVTEGRYEKKERSKTKRKK